MSKKLLMSSLIMLGLLYINGYDFGQTKHTIMSWVSADTWAPGTSSKSDWGSKH